MSADEQIIASLIDDLMHEARVLVTLADLPLKSEYMLKISIVCHNMISIFERFEVLRIKDRLKAKEKKQ